MNILNLYAGVGGNRKHWEGIVTAVELDPKIADIYQQQYPDDKVIVGDAHEYLLDYYSYFDFIWSSPPCQSHSKLDRCNPRNEPRYPEMELYQEIIFLQTYFGGKWVVENVVPYYEPLIPAMRIDRHLFWANFHIGKLEIPRPSNHWNNQTVAGKKEIMDWLDIHFEENVYYGNNHDPTQVLKNCVHPELGKHVMQCAYQPTLF